MNKKLAFLSSGLAFALFIGSAGTSNAELYNPEFTSDALCSDASWGMNSNWPTDPSFFGVYNLNYPSDWPSEFKRLPTQDPQWNESYLSYTWYCRWDSGILTHSYRQADRFDQSQSVSTVVPVGSTITMKKLDLSRSGDSKIMTKAEWDYDGDGTYEVADTGPWPTFSRGDIRWVSFQGNLKFSSPGNRTVNLKITHADGSVDTNSGTFTAVADVPTARIVSPVSIAFTGAATELSASGTTTLGGISNYDWDTNGDGSYETSGGVTKSISWDTVGSKSVGVRVTSRDGHTSTASVVVEVRKTTPGSRPSISINSGNPYTNSKEVSLGIVWPAYATTMDISNDGGFPSSQTQTVAVGENISWALDDSIYGLYTKVVYVRFNGSGVDVNKVYSDDVVLDTTAPKLSSASSAKGSGAVDASMVSGISSFVNSDIRLAKKAKSTTKVVRIKTKAKDERSGLGKVQVALSASGKSAVTVPYKTQIKVTVPKSAKKVWVRVADGAGNWSKWKVLKAK